MIIMEQLVAIYQRQLSCKKKTTHNQCKIIPKDIPVFLSQNQAPSVTLQVLKYSKSWVLVFIILMLSFSIAVPGECTLLPPNKEKACLNYGS